MTERTGLAVIWGLMWVLVVPYFLVTQQVYRLLRSKYPQTWNELGAPSLFPSNTLRSNLQRIKFVWSGSFKKLNDEQLDSLVGKKRILEATLFVLLLVFSYFVVF
ncbi:MAG: hypothetical protein WBO54_15580 [Thermoanaerobaculia bacterium]